MFFTDKVDDADIGNEGEKNKSIVDVKDYLGLGLHQHNLEDILEPSFSSVKTRLGVEKLLKDLLHKIYNKDEVAKSIIVTKING